MTDFSRLEDTLQQIAVDEEAYLRKRIRAFWLRPYTLKLARFFLIIEKTPLQMSEHRKLDSTEFILREKFRVKSRIKLLRRLFLKDFEDEISAHATAREANHDALDS